MFDIHHYDRLTHKESTKERQKQDNEAENAVHSTLQKFGVFSSQTIATPEIEQSLVQARSLGQTQLERFVERTLLSSDREEEQEWEEGADENFCDPIRKNNPPTFAILYEVKSAATSSEKRKILHADRSILCRLVTAYEARREVNMQTTLQPELIPVPLSPRNEPHHANVKQVYFSRRYDRKGQVPGVSYTSRKCCLVHRWFYSGGSYWKARKSKDFRWLCGLLRGHCVTERFWIPEDRCVIRSLSEALHRSNDKTSTLQEHGAACAQSY